tara:strand:+ start:178 stop:321 length:144 start_codon:yes stop_codon:yes gene_type:complete
LALGDIIKLKNLYCGANILKKFKLSHIPKIGEPWYKNAIIKKNTDIK